MIYKNNNGINNRQPINKVLKKLMDLLFVIFDLNVFL